MVRINRWENEKQIIWEPCFANIPKSTASNYLKLVGGFNPSENISQWERLSHIIIMENIKYLKPPTRKFMKWRNVRPSYSRGTWLCFSNWKACWNAGSQNTWFKHVDFKPWLTDALGHWSLFLWKCMKPSTLRSKTNGTPFPLRLSS